MTKASFYVLADSTPDARLHMACRLADKAYRLGHRILMLVDDQHQAEKLDKRLWSWQPDSFLPHSLLSAELDSPVEIVSTDALPSDLHALPHQVLINLSEVMVAAEGGCERIIEIVIQADPWRSNARERLKQYRQQGFEVEVNDLRKH